MNLYRDRWNQGTYCRDLRALFANGKPVLITEFGCCAFAGAERMGGGGWLIVDHSQSPAVVKPGYARDESVQAREIDALLDLYRAEGVHGAFVYNFLDASHRTDSRPEFDLDRASYGLVKVLPATPGETSLSWERRAAFATVAEHFARDA